MTDGFLETDLRRWCLICYRCNADIDLRTVHRPDLCPKCKTPLHACLGCRFYDPKASHECLEPEAEWVSDKAAANFCDFFASGSVFRPGFSKREQKAKNKLDDFFNNLKI
jgi:hypothetical protein